jgi:hypothetical protein
LELQAKFLYSLNTPYFADSCIIRAYHAYEAYGAHRKLEIMQVKHAHILDAVLAKQLQQQQINRTSFPFNSNTGTMNLASAFFYLESVVKASQVISSSIDIEKLLCNVMKIVRRIIYLY